jgi:hypothetical protein
MLKRRTCKHDGGMHSLGSGMCGYLLFFNTAIGRGTLFISEFAEVSAKICESCGNECKKYDHEHCQKCAEICLRCAEEC